MPQRFTYEESCKNLQDLNVIDSDEIPPMPERMPRYDDEEPLGLGFFRTELADVELDLFTLPRTFFSRSEIRAVSFRDADLSESSANWSDFTDIDFSNADLSRCDLRASKFERVKFTGATLTAVDIRHSTFVDCDFSGADVRGLKLTHGGAAWLKLSAVQLATVALQDSEGDEPEGG